MLNTSGDRDSARCAVDAAGWNLLLAAVREWPAPAGEGACASGGGGAGPAGDEEWRRLLALARRHAVLPLLHAWLGASPWVPREVRRDLEREAAVLECRNLYLTAALGRVLAALEAQGVRALPYKGPALAVRLYGSLALRPFSDLDVFVREGDVAAAARALAGIGYESWIPAGLDAMVRRHGIEWPMENAGGILVELHWGLAERWFGAKLPAHVLWSGADVEPVRLPFGPVPIHRAEPLLLMLAMHGARHAWAQLSMVADVYRLIGTSPDLDWDRAWALARRARAERILIMALGLARRLLGTPLPEAIGRAVDDAPWMPAVADRVIRGMVDPARPGFTAGDHAGVRLRLRDSWWRRWLLPLAGALTPTLEDLRTVRLPRWAAGFYPLVHPTRFAFEVRARAPSAVGATKSGGRGPEAECTAVADLTGRRGIDEVRAQV